MHVFCAQAAQPVKSTRYPAKDKKRTFAGSTFEVVRAAAGGHAESEDDYEDADVDDDSEGENSD